MKKFIFLIFLILFFFKNLYLINHGFFDDKARFFNDFHSYYIGSYLFWHGQNPYDTAGDFSKAALSFNLHFLFGTGYSYPPLLAFLFFPLLFFQPLVAARIFAGLTMMLYMAFCFLILRERKKQSFLNLFFLSLFLATFLPAVDSANHGQVNIIVLFCIFLYFKLEGREKLSSFFLVFASLVKVYPVFFLVKELIEKKVKFILSFFFWAAGLVIITAIAGGFNLWKIYFFKVLPKIGSSLDAYYTNQSINGVLSRMLLGNDRKYMISQEVYHPIFLTIELLLLIFLIYVTLKKRNEKIKLFLLWLGVISLLAGKNSFSNFTPCVLIGIYLIDNFQKIKKIMKILFIFSIFLSNFAWQYVWIFNRNYILENNLFSKLIYVSVTSVGFIFLFIQIIILLSLFKKRG